MDFFVVTLSRMMKNVLAKSNDENPVFTRSFYRRLSQSLENASENINLLDIMAIDCCFLMNFSSRLLPKLQSINVS